MIFIFWCLFIILPVFFSGITFIFFLKLLVGKLNFPLDLGLKFRGKRLFGNNKTIKGPIFMSFFTMIYGFLVFNLLKDNLKLNYPCPQVLINFLLVGLSYSLGELPNSFLKRQLGILPGENHSNVRLNCVFYGLDLFDSLILIGIAYVLLFRVEIILVIVSILVGGILHFATDKLMIKLSLKKEFGKKRKN
jgi:hypothetical protein